MKKQDSSISITSTKMNRKIQHPIHLTFDKLKVKVDDKLILNDISGEVKPGEVLAIMGPSGAGKSTLLNFLAGREHGMTLESGQILLNGKKSNKRLRRGIGYVLQQDTFFSHLTVTQTLNFVGEVRLPDSFSKSEKRAVVNEVVEELGLKKCANTVMGGGIFVTGCSGGEKKRCSIAVELITNPALLIMDEPTSGLDSSTACNLIQTVKKLAQEENRAVITTIHQPSSHVFHMFDKLLLICNGQVAYYGKTSEVVQFFKEIEMPCYENWNPADYIMEQLTADEKTQQSIIQGFQKYKERRSSTSKDCEVIEGSNGVENHTKLSDIQLDNDDDEVVITNGNANKNETSVEMKVFKDPVSTKDVKMPRWPTGYKTQAIALCKRAFIQSKSEFWDKLSFIQTFCIAIVTGLLWFDTPYNEDSLQDRRGLMFFVMIYLIMSPMFLAIMTFPTERDAIAKERAAGMYRLSAYYTAKCLSELPVLLFQPILLFTIMYWLTALNRSPVFLLGLLNIITVTLLAQTFGLCIGASVKNFKQSITIAVVFALTAMLLGGFYTKRIPYWLDWAKYISHITYAYNIFMRLEFQHATETFKCAKESAFLICNNNMTTTLTGSDILPTVTTIDLGIVESFMVLLGYIVVFRFVFYLALKYLNKPK